MTRVELIDLYCQDWKETDKPWERWKVWSSCDQRWITQDKHLNFLLKPDRYRRKPDTITVNGVECPAPYRGKMDGAQKYYLPNVCGDEELAVPRFWHHLGDDIRKRDAGLVYLKKEDAIARAKAMMLYEGGE